MRRMKVKKWKSKQLNPDGSVDEVEEDILDALNTLIGFIPPKDMPNGIDKFRLFNKISKAFDKADESGVLELGETEYSFLKNSIEGHIPAKWGFNKDIYQAVEEFLNLKLEEGD